MTSLIEDLGSNATEMKKDDIKVQIEDLAQRVFSIRLVFGVCVNSQMRIPGSEFARFACYQNMHLSCLNIHLKASLRCKALMSNKNCT